MAMARHHPVQEAEASLGRASHWIWQSLGLGLHNYPGRYTVLLFSILLLLIVQPVFATHSLAQAIVTASMSLMLLSALYTLNESRSYFIFGTVLMIPAFVCRWILQFHRNRPVEVVAAVTASAFVLVIVIGIVRQLFSIKRVTLDTISAAICAYFLIALAWAFMFALVELEHPGSFSSGLFIQETGASPVILVLHNFIYYSFVCLTTTGYGDIAPKSDMARTLSVLESVIGQMYLAILIARLVSIQVAQSMVGDRNQ